jgi:hypothetical protein
MTAMDIARLLERLPQEEQIEFAVSLMRGFLIAKIEKGELAETIGQLIGATGIVMVVVDDNGVRLRDAVVDGQPRSQLAHAVLEAVYPACESAIATVMGKEGTVVPGSVPS